MDAEGEEYSGVWREKSVTVAMASQTFFVNCYVFLSLLVSSDQVHGFQSRRPTSNSHLHHTHLQLTSLIPSSNCTLYEPDPKKVSSLKVVHKHGTCNQHRQDAPNVPPANEVLLQDQARVDFIHSRLSNVSRDDYLTLSETTTVPARYGAELGTGNYIVTVGLGTPKKELSLIFDTGSDLTWTQCEPCLNFCYDQQEPVFDPSRSSSYANISCSSPLCSQLQSGTGTPPGCHDGSTCLYGIHYGDQSFSVGYYSEEKLSLTTTDVIDDFRFGCGQYNRGLFGEAAGILGLGQNNISFIQQSAQKYGRVFSYCLPSKSSLTGYLAFGNSSGIAVRYTPLSNISLGSNYYPVDIEGISVAGHKLPIPGTVFTAAGALIDSGTVITRLPPAAYSALKSKFQKEMAAYPKAPALSILDTCYNLTGYTTIKVPVISFFFKGGVTVKLHPTGILLVPILSQVCLAFAANRNPTDVAIFGNSQQKTLEVVYDVAGGRVGFAPGGCK